MITDLLIKRLEDARDRAWAIAEEALEAIETGVPSQRSETFSDKEMLERDKHMYTHWNGFAEGFDYAIHMIKDDWGLNGSLKSYKPVKYGTYGTHPRRPGVNWRKDFGQI